MNPQYKCICCSTSTNVIYVVPTEKDGFLSCPNCGSIELEEVL